jgi:hypothetical protein
LCRSLQIFWKALYTTLPSFKFYKHSASYLGVFPPESRNCTLTFRCFPPESRNCTFTFRCFPPESRNSMLTFKEFIIFLRDGETLLCERFYHSVNWIATKFISTAAPCISMWLVLLVPT